MAKNKHLLSRIKGCLIGGAIGDALGRTVEREAPQTTKIRELLKMAGPLSGLTVHIIAATCLSPKYRCVMMLVAIR